MVAPIGSYVKVVHAHDKSVISCDLKQKLVLNTLNASNISSHFILFYHHLRNSSFGRRKRQWNQLNYVEKCIEEKNRPKFFCREQTFHLIFIQLPCLVHYINWIRMFVHVWLCECACICVCVSVCLYVLVCVYSNDLPLFTNIIAVLSLSVQSS